MKHLSKEEILEDKTVEYWESHFPDNALKEEGIYVPYDLAIEAMEQYKEQGDRELLIHFLDDLREYIRESDNNISHDDRSSAEFVDIFLAQKEKR